MRISSLRRVWLAVGLLAAVSALFAGLAMSETTVTSTTKDALSENATNVNMSTTGGTPVTITSFTVPAGAWVVSADPTLVNFGPSDYFRCKITENGTQVAAGATMVGNPNLPGAEGPGVYVTGRPLIGGFKTSASVLVALACQHDHNTPSGEGPGYADAGSVLLAHKGTVIAGAPTS